MISVMNSLTGTHIQTHSMRTYFVTCTHQSIATGTYSPFSEAKLHADKQQKLQIDHINHVHFDSFYKLTSTYRSFNAVYLGQIIFVINGTQLLKYQLFLLHICGLFGQEFTDISNRNTIKIST